MHQHEPLRLRLDEDGLRAAGLIQHVLVLVQQLGSALELKGFTLCCWKLLFSLPLHPKQFRNCGRLTRSTDKSHRCLTMLQTDGLGHIHVGSIELASGQWLLH